MAGSDYSFRLSAQDNLSGTLKNVKQAVNDLGNTATTSLDKFTQKFQKIEQSSAPLKRQLKDLQTLMAEMNFKGLSNTEEFTKIAQYAGQVKDAISDAAAATRRFADDTMALRAAADAFSVITGAATAVTGAMNLFGVKNEEVAQAILKVQSAMAVLNGVQAVANALNKDSALMQSLKALKMKVVTEYTKLNTIETNKNTVSEVANKTASEADAVAKTKSAIATNLETASTKKGTIAQNAWNIAKAIAKALVGDFTGLLIVGAGAIATYAIATADSTDELEENNRAIDANSENIKRNKEIHEEWANKVADSAGSQLATYSLLQAKWKECNGDIKLQQKFMKDYKSEIDSLNIGIKDLLSAEKAFVQYTDAVVNAIMARARAEAGKEVYKEEYKKWINEQMNPTVDNGGKYVRVNAGAKFGEEISAEEEKYLRSLPNSFNKYFKYQSTMWSHWYETTEEGAELINAYRHQQGVEKLRERDKNYRNRLDKIQKEYIEKPLEEYENATKEIGINANYSSAVGGHRAYSGGGSHGGTNTNKGGNNYEEGSIEYYKARNSEIEKELSRSKELKLTEEYVAQRVKEKAENTKKIAELEQKQKDAVNAQKLNELNVAKSQEKQNLSIEEKQQLIKEIDELMNLGIPTLKEETDLLKFQAQLLKDIEKHKKHVENGKWLAANNNPTLPSSNVDTSDIKTPYDSRMELYQNVMNNFSRLQQEYNAGIIDKDKFMSDLEVIKKIAEENKLKITLEPEVEPSKMQVALDNAANTLGTLAGAFSQLGQATQDMALNAAGTIAQAIANIWLGYSQATTQAATLGPWAWIGFAAAGLAQTVGVIAALKSNSFADGGIVGGSSYHGDKLWAKLNAGEMILNGSQQRNLFNAINKNELGGGESASAVSFRIKGSDLYGVLKNYSSIKSKTGKNIGIK